MTTTRQSCMCECEECLALRAAEDDPGPGQTVAAFEYDGNSYEIEYFGIGPGSRWGDFGVYCDGDEVAEFAIAESVLGPWPRPAGLPVSADELVRLGRRALCGWTGRDETRLVRSRSRTSMIRGKTSWLQSQDAANARPPVSVRS